MYNVCVCLCVSYALHLLLLGSCYAVHNMQVELIRFRKNINFIDVGNFEVGIYFRDRHVYETGLIAIRDVLLLF